MMIAGTFKTNINMALNEMWIDWNDRLDFRRGRDYLKTYKIKSSVVLFGEVEFEFNGTYVPVARTDCGTKIHISLDLVGEALLRSDKIRVQNGKLIGFFVLYKDGRGWRLDPLGVRSFNEERVTWLPREEWRRDSSALEFVFDRGWDHEMREAKMDLRPAIVQKYAYEQQDSVIHLSNL